MKGMVFTEMLEMVEQEFGVVTLDRMITRAGLPHSGAYTAVGTYPHQEMVQLVVALSGIVGEPTATLVKAFGRHLFRRFTEGHGIFFAGVGSAFELLGSVQNHVHVEVRKLYPDAELPTFVCSHPDPDTMVMVYHSTRPFADLAEGLIEATIDHFADPLQLHREDLPGPDTRVKFTLTRRGH